MIVELHEVEPRNLVRRVTDGAVGLIVGKPPVRFPTSTGEDVYRIYVDVVNGRLEAWNEDCEVEVLAPKQLLRDLANVISAFQNQRRLLGGMLLQVVGLDQVYTVHAAKIEEANELFLDGDIVDGKHASVWITGRRPRS
jgi:hypothetical protein